MAAAKSGIRRQPKRCRTAKVRMRPADVMKPEYLSEIARFRLMDDDFMSKCLENAPDCIELILQIILGRKDLKVVKTQTEYPIKSLQGRGVRFDVFARDSDGKEYDIEIQRADAGADAKRARYNSALMDANALKSGEDVGRLRDTYVIFITESDVMGGGKEVYSYCRKEECTGEDLGDGTHIVYVNGAAQSASDIGRLVHDLQCRDVELMHFDILKRQVGRFKKSEEGRRTMCEVMEKIKARGIAEGEARGIAKGEARGIVKGEARGKREVMFATAKRLLANGKLMLKEIAECSGLSLAQVKKLQASLA